MITCDAHMHTRFSEDSDASVHSMLDAAVEKDWKQYISRIILIKIFQRHRIFLREHSCLIWMNIFKD